MTKPAIARPVCRHLPARRHAQRGMAALLVVLLTGMSLSALTLGVMHYTKGAQDSNHALHARTQAEINAWAGVEALRQYVQGKQASDLPSLQEVAIRNAAGQTLATVHYQASCSNVTAGEYCFHVVGRSANSTATLAAGLRLSSASPSYPRLQTGLAVNGGLNVSGNLFQVRNGASGMGGVSVDGDINIDKISTSASSPTCATGNIKIGGNGAYTGSYLAQGDIWVFGGATAQDVSLQARSVVIGGNAEDGRLRPGGASRYQRISYQQFLATGPLEIRSLQGGGNLYAPSPWLLPTLESGSIGGQAYGIPGYNTAAQLATCRLADGRFACTEPVVEGSEYVIPRLSTRLPQTIPPVQCQTALVNQDANRLEALANYVFYFDEQHQGRPTLKIQHMRSSSGVDLSGTYDLSQTTLAMTSFPAAPTIPLLRCNGGSCRLWEKTAATGWGKLAGLEMPPGVVLFKTTAANAGSVEISAGNSVLYNTLLSGGTLTLANSGLRSLVAPNFSASGSATPRTAAACSQLAYPSQLCDGAGHLKTWTDSQGEHQGIPVGNMAVVVNGSFAPNGWSVAGNVVISKLILVSGQRVTIRGAVWVGDGQTLADGDISEITHDGLEIDVSTLAPDQSYIDNGGDGTAPGSGGSSGQGGQAGGSGSGGTGTITGSSLARVRPL